MDIGYFSWAPLQVTPPFISCTTKIVRLKKMLVSSNSNSNMSLYFWKANRVMAHFLWTNITMRKRLFCIYTSLERYTYVIAYTSKQIPVSIFKVKGFRVYHLRSINPLTQGVSKTSWPPAPKAPSSSKLLEVVTQTPISSTQACYVPITLAPSIIHSQKATQQHVVGNKIGYSFAIMLPHVYIVGKKTSIPLIMENGIDTNTILLETLGFIKW